ncbi:hypothetical protein FKG96_12440 [Olivibacter sp. LS-1]|uniref:hypothetical protein n=1 Tax=Olivibacter sp. LS-1 TaxID=2592345 RepID=UPI0011EB586D|nr:hypothetical protein [Olivibacter sp. LS-1]QEL01581.1 hypothetical protein FKG96_12440 [Olivibacter sp. LS-1]
MSRRSLQWIIVGIVILIIINIIFILIVLSPSIVGIFDFTSKNTSNIATTISGLTSPILTVGSAYLLYLALTKQIESNNEQRRKNDFDMVTLLYNQLNKEYNSIEFRVVQVTDAFTRKETSKVVIEVGDRALKAIYNTYKRTPKQFKDISHMAELSSIIATFVLLETAIKNLRAPDTRTLFEEKIRYFYIYKLKVPLQLISECVRTLDESERPETVFHFFKRKQREYFPDYSIDQLSQDVNTGSS